MGRMLCLAYMAFYIKVFQLKKRSIWKIKKKIFFNNKYCPAAEQTNDSEEALAVTFFNGLLPYHDLTHSEHSGDNSDRKNICSVHLPLSTELVDGTVQFVGKGTLKKGGEVLKIYRGNGIEFVTLLESGTGMDLSILFIP
jgi:hypothetical protein